MAQSIVSHDSGGGLFISDGPVYLYALADKRPRSPLVFPPHLNEYSEVNVSQFDTSAEVLRVLRLRPGVVVLSVFPRTQFSNYKTKSAVEAYVENNCRLVDVETSYEAEMMFLIGIWGDCRSDTPYLMP